MENELSQRSLRARLVEPDVFGMVLGLGPFKDEDLVQILAKGTKYRSEPTCSEVGTALWGLAIEVVETVVLVRPQKSWSGKISSLWKNQLLELPELHLEKNLLWCGKVKDRFQLEAFSALQRTTLYLNYRK